MRRISSGSAPAAGPPTCRTWRLGHPHKGADQSLAVTMRQILRFCCTGSILCDGGARRCRTGRRVCCTSTRVCCRGTIVRCSGTRICSTGTFSGAQAPKSAVQAIYIYIYIYIYICVRGTSYSLPRRHHNLTHRHCCRDIVSAVQAPSSAARAI